MVLGASFLVFMGIVMKGWAVCIPGALLAVYVVLLYVWFDVADPYMSMVLHRR